MRTYDQFGTVIINGMPRVVTPVCDKHRHLVCEPYSIEILHEVARFFQIGRHWFHKDHYDIPIRRLAEIVGRCKVVESKQIVEIIKKDYGTLRIDTVKR